jgi:hypothetical protein
MRWRNDVKETEKDIGRGTQRLRNQKRQEEEEEQVSFLLLLLLFIGFHQTCTHVQHMAVCLVTIGSSSSTWGGFYFILFFRGMKEIRNQRTPPCKKIENVNISLSKVYWNIHNQS